MRRINKFIATSLLTLAATGIFPADSSASTPNVGVVGAVNPAAMAELDKNRRVLELGKEVIFNERIITNADGNAQILFIDKSALTVGPNSDLVIDKFVYDPKKSTGDLVINSTKGAFRFVGGALSKKKPVIFKTPVATIGIRGGIAIVNVDAQTGATNATFVYGVEMTMQNANGDIQKTTQPGFGISLLTPTSLPTVPVKVDTQVLTQQMNTLAGKEGTSAGAVGDVSDKSLSDTSALTVSEDTTTETTDDNGGGETAAAETSTTTETTEAATSEDSGTITESTTAATTVVDNSSVAKSATELQTPSTTKNFIATKFSAAQVAAVTNSVVARPQFICTDCEFVSWGMWDTNSNAATSSNSIDLKTAVPVIRGDVTQNLGQLARTGNVNYTGKAIGNIVYGATAGMGTGDLLATVDMDNRLLSSLSISNFTGGGVSNVTFATTGPSSIAASGGATFNNVFVDNFDGTLGYISGTVNGALFGPNAQNIGGTFNVSNGSNFSSTGVYLGGE